MKRRALLASVTGLAGATLAGCLSAGDSSGGPGDETTTDDPTTDETTTDDPTTDDTTTDGTTTTDGLFGLAGTSIERTDSRCASGDTGTADVDFGNLRATVDGTIEAATPCHLPKVRAYEYDEATGTFRLTVAVVDDPETDVCVECIGAIDYVLDIDFEGDLPETVEIAHWDGQKATVVASADSPDV